MLQATSFHSHVHPLPHSSNGVEKFKFDTHHRLTSAFATDLFATVTEIPNNFPFLPFNAYHNLPPFTHQKQSFPLEDDSWFSMVPTDKEDIVSEIEQIVERSRSNSPQPVKQEPSVETPPSSQKSCVHPRAPDDAHYPFKVLRKNRTKMRSGVCVWCAARLLMALPERPQLRRRASGTDADWERWLRELNSPRSAFLRHLAETLLPKHDLLKVIRPAELQTFYKDIAGALIELALRELRAGVVDERSIMAQVRSSKYHKTNRVAGIIETAYL